MSDKRLLWTDDEKERFLFEREVLEDEGWEVVWAENLLEAAEKLREERFTALLLDLQLPYRFGTKPSVWGGCVLLHWLRGKEDLPGDDALAADYDELSNMSASIKNQEIGVLIVSAYHDDEILDYIRKASSRDADAGLITKPVDENQILNWLKEVIK